MIRKDWLKSEDLMEINEMMGSKIFTDPSVSHVQSVSLRLSEEGVYVIEEEPRPWVLHSTKRERTKEAYRELGQLDKDSDHLIIGSKVAIGVAEALLSLVIPQHAAAQELD